jgi:membrane protein implicated in regulation of membrane protease activity
MDPWVWWVIAAVVFLVAEMITTTLFMIPFSAGALVAMGADLGGLPLVAQIALFLGASGAAFMVVRPIARRHRTMPPQIRTGTAALIGRGAMVLDPVSRDGGSVKIEGEVWSARPLDEDDVLVAGTRVQVIQIKGATAIVSE